MSRKKSITKKGERSAAKRYFWVGVILMITAGIVWVVNGAGGRMDWARADNDTGTSNASGHFSETWTASEMFGLVRYWWQKDHPDGTIDGSNAGAWVAKTVKRKNTNIWNSTRCKGLRTELDPQCVITNGLQGYSPYIHGADEGVYWTTWRDAFHKQDAIGVLSIDSPQTDFMPTVTQWTVNGHIH